MNPPPQDRLTCGEEPTALLPVTLTHSTGPIRLGTGTGQEQGIRPDIERHQRQVSRIVDGRAKEEDVPIRRGDGGEIVDEPTEPVRERGGSGDGTTARDEATDSIARSGPASLFEPRST